MFKLHSNLFKLHRIAKCTKGAMCSNNTIQFYSNKSRHDDFQDYLVPKQSSPLDEIQVKMHERHRTDDENSINDSINEIIAMANDYRYRRNDIRNAETNLSRFKKASFLSPKNKETMKEENNDSDFNDYIRDEHGVFAHKEGENESNNFVNEKRHERDGEKGESSKIKQSYLQNSVTENMNVRSDVNEDVNEEENERNYTLDPEREREIERKSVLRFSELLDGPKFSTFKNLYGSIAQREVPFVFSNLVEWHKLAYDLHIKLAKDNQIDTSTFSGLGVSKQLTNQLDHLGLKKPTDVQASAIPLILSKRSVVIQSETASGKTLTFLLPLIHNFMLTRKTQGSIVIIVPTRELATQIFNTVLSLGVKPSHVSRHVGESIETCKPEDELSDEEITLLLKKSRMLIGTPRKLLEIMENNPIAFKSLRAVVLDEVDQLVPNEARNLSKMKDSIKILAFINYLKELYEKEHKKYHHVQLIGTSATMRYSTLNVLLDYGFVQKTEFVSLLPEECRFGKMPDNIRHFYTIVPDVENGKVNTIAQMVLRFREKSVLVVIGAESVDKTVEQFRNKGVVTTALYREMKVETEKEFKTDFENGSIQVAVINKDAIRGMDIPFVSTIYATYVPKNSDAYLHLAGRAGRRGQTSKVVTLFNQSEHENVRNHYENFFSKLNVQDRKSVV